MILAYPQDGATGVPTNFGTLLYYAGGADLQLRLASGAARIPTSPAAVPSSLPSPIASPDAVGEALSARSVPTLEPNTTYAVRYTYSSYVANCAAETYQHNETLGSFTTQ